jgi:hypothetical protein
MGTNKGGVMPRIEIYFAGLICHVGANEKEGADRVALVKSILIPDATETKHTPRIRTMGGVDETLNGEVTFEGLGAGATAGPLFLDTVPHLDDFTRSGVELNQDILKPRPSNFPYTVQLPLGEFTVVEFYEQGAKWTLDGDVSTRPCVPRVTMLRASGTAATVHFNGRSVNLTSDSWILLTNFEVQPPANPGDDWKKQYAVTTGTPDDLAVYEELPKTVPCTKYPENGRWTVEVLGKIRPPAVVDSSECTNSHWP